MNAVLRPASERPIKALDLFAGCGGLALGFEAQGFETLGFERDADCVDTYNKNLAGECVRTELTPESDLPDAQVIIAGPPCQPFSVGGKQMGLADSRDGFPTYLSAVERVRPDVCLFENVRGLFYRNRWYLAEITERLRGMGYEVTAALLNAKHYGVPQNRERVIVVGHQGRFRLPRPTETLVSAGDAVGDTAHRALPGARYLTTSQDAYVARYEKASNCATPRDLHLDRPARTLTCRNLAGATGDMQRVRLPDGRRRRLTVAEAARLQSFPDWFEFVGREESRFNQLGNAVAPLFAFHLAATVRQYLSGGLALSEEALF